jgi:hypothetical protein
MRLFPISIIGRRNGHVLAPRWCMMSLPMRFRNGGGMFAAMHAAWPDFYAGSAILAPTTSNRRALAAPRIRLARATSSSLPCAITMKRSACMSASYWITLSLGMPMP